MVYNELVVYGQTIQTAQTAQRAVADVSGIAYFAPIFAFLLVFVVVYAVLLKTRLLGEHKLGLVFVSFLVATLFISFAGGIDYVLTITPWLAILLISLFFVLLLAGLIGKEMEFMNKPVGVIVLIVSGIIFLVSGYVVFSEVIGQYFPYSRNYVINTGSEFIFSPRVVGAVVILIVAALASIVLVKYSKEK